MNLTGQELVVLLIGFAGQSMFFMRFFVQWLYSEKHRRSMIPTAFWYFSLAGSALLLTYAIIKQDPVFITGQSTGFIIYTRNLVLIRREQREKWAASDEENAEASPNQGLA